MYTLEDITAVICNWQQTRFTLGAVNNLHKMYPMIRIIVVDDGSQDERGDFNTAYAREAYCKEERHDNSPFPDGTTTNLFNVIRTGKHVGHGSALDYGFYAANTPLVLTMDNDIRIILPGLVEKYLEELNSDLDNIYAVGTTYSENDPRADWIDPWFSLYQRKPITDLHLTFSNFLFPVPGKTFHIGTGAFLHTMMTYDTLHRPHIWRAVHYPEPEAIPQLWHLKKFPTDKAGDKRYDMWQEFIDG
jgi:glycosyltransferase involved in cell wall biosynthesis